jgi:hypothetical protein
MKMSRSDLRKVTFTEPTNVAVEGIPRSEFQLRKSTLAIVRLLRGCLIVRMGNVGRLLERCLRRRRLG